MQSLPKGLVTTSPRIPSHLTKDPGKSPVDAGDIALLWKGIFPSPLFLLFYLFCGDSGGKLTHDMTQSITPTPPSTITTRGIGWRTSFGECGGMSGC